MKNFITLLLILITKITLSQLPIIDNSVEVHILRGVSDSIILPVELLTFDAKANGENNKIFWVTVNEINNDHFTLEKSYDGNNFIEVVKINGQGNSYEKTYYQYDDINESLITYYRLKQTDFNGDTESFNIISVMNDYGTDDKIIKITNTLGQIIDENYNGLKLYYFKSGKIIKIQ